MSPRPTSSGRAARAPRTLEIHDTVLIAAAFCMFNRYVDGLATWAPHDLDTYRARAAKGAHDGYGSATAIQAAASGDAG